MLCNLYGISVFRNTQPRFQFIVMNRRNTGQSLSFFAFYLVIWELDIYEVFVLLVGEKSSVLLLDLDIYWYGQHISHSDQGHFLMLPKWCTRNHSFQFMLIFNIQQTLLIHTSSHGWSSKDDKNRNAYLLYQDQLHSWNLFWIGLKPHQLIWSTSYYIW